MTPQKTTQLLTRPARSPHRFESRFVSRIENNPLPEALQKIGVPKGSRTPVSGVRGPTNFTKDCGICDATKA